MSEKKEYIERGALIKRLNSLVTTSDLFGMGVQAGFSHAITEANAIPAAGVEPVVRCKDCKWYETGVCDFLGAVTLDDDYCSIGARTERSGSGE